MEDIPFPGWVEGKVEGGEEQVYKLWFTKLKGGISTFLEL